MSILCGIDPGKMTGYSVYDSELQVFLYMGMYNDDPRECVNRVRSLMSQYWPDTEPIVESFIPRFGTKFDLDGVYLIGALQSQWDIHLVAPASHKSLVKDSVLNPLMKASKFAIGAGHSRDAGRLCLYYSAAILKEASTLKAISSHK